MGEFIKEANKTYYHPGDIVSFKGIEHSEGHFEMKVKKLEWEINDERKRVLKGVWCYWIDSYGQEQVKIYDTRDIFKVERKAVYYLQEAKKALGNNTELIQKVNEILNNL